MPRRKLRHSHVLALVAVQVSLFIKCLVSVRGEIIPHHEHSHTHTHTHAYNAFDYSSNINNIVSNDVEGFRFSTRRRDPGSIINYNNRNSTSPSYIDKRLNVDTETGSIDTHKRRPKEKNIMLKNASSFLSDTIMLNSNIQKMRRNVRHSLANMNMLNHHKPDDIMNMTKKKITKKVSKGKLTVDFGSGVGSISPPVSVQTLTGKFDGEFQHHRNNNMGNDDHTGGTQGKVEVSMDPLAGARAFIVLLNAALTFGSAFTATLRLLTPL